MDKLKELSEIKKMIEIAHNISERAEIVNRHRQNFAKALNKHSKKE
jgi:hypothetical protein